MKKPEVLLIGGTGYIGGYLKKTLESDFHVSVTGRKPSGADTYFLDLADPEPFFSALKGRQFDVVIFLASKVDGLGTLRLDSDVLDVNCIQFSHVMQHLIDQNCYRKFVYVSSMTVYGVENRPPVSEVGVKAPLSTYGLSKYLAEEIVRHAGLQHGLPSVSLRIPGIYGGGRKSGFIHNVTSKCLKGESVILDTKGLGYWETMHIDDLCKAIRDFIVSYPWHQSYDVFNLGYGVSTDMVDCAHRILVLTESPSKLEIIEPRGYVEFFMDNSKIKQYINLENSFHDSLKSYVKELDHAFCDR